MTTPNEALSIAPPIPLPVAGDAEDARRYEFVLDCDVIAARQYMPNLDVQAYKNKIRARHDAAIAAGGK